MISKCAYQWVSNDTIDHACILSGDHPATEAHQCWCGLSRMGEGSDIRDALLLDENGALYNSSGLRQAIDGAMSHIARALEGANDD